MRAAAGACGVSPPITGNGPTLGSDRVHSLDAGMSRPAKSANQPKCSRPRGLTGRPSRRPITAVITLSGTPSSATAW